MEHHVTFVTSYLRVYNEEYDFSKTFEKRLVLFKKVVELGLHICVFTSPEFEHIFREIALHNNNVCILQILDVEDLWFAQKAKQMTKEMNIEWKLPEKRSRIKDTCNYMLLMHAKVDFMKRAIDANPFHHQVFAWFDFSLPYVFKDPERTLIEMKNHSAREYPAAFLVMPGCWTIPTGPFTKENFLKDQICWRFCGGFFMGDKESILSFYETSIAYFDIFLFAIEYHIVWEVNYWAWLEANGHIHPLWYPADHNDSIIDIPYSLYVKSLINHANQVITYSYPAIEDPHGDRFFPSSASYIYDEIREKHILNTRYVNYFYKDNWDCIFFNEHRQIRTVNVCSELNTTTFEPIEYDIVMNDETNLKPNQHAFSLGLEDIRLYKENNQIMFIASNVHYHSYGKNRMIVGEYDYEENLCKNMQIIHMQWDSECEKNWVPLPSTTTTYFIYKFSPYTVGYLNKNDNNQLIYLHKLPEKSFKHKLLNRFRGSSSFIHYDDNHWIGVVHYSERTVPPTYYHCLLLINKQTKNPIIFSDPFKFGSQPIEFCIGFSMQREKYFFWISQMDRDPKLLTVDKDNIPLNNKCY